MIVFVRYIARCLTISLGCLVAHQSSAADQRYQVLLPDGRPAAHADVTFRKFSRPNPDSRAIEDRRGSTDENGWLVVPDAQAGQFHLIVIDTPDAALGLWNFPVSGKPLQLAPKYRVGGHVISQDDRPVSEAEVQVLHFGTFTYSRVFSELTRGLNGLSARTNEQGQFELRGATLNGYKFPAGAIIFVQGNVNGHSCTAEFRNSYAGDSDWYDKDTIRPTNNEPIRLFPLSQLRGRVINAATGRPLNAATISYYRVADLAAQPVITDGDGAFELLDVPTYQPRRFQVDHELLAKPIVVTEATQPDSESHDPGELMIQAWPRQEFRGRAIDATSGRAPLIPLDIGFTQVHTPLAGWQSVSAGSWGNIGRAARTDAEGSFVLELPTGEFTLRFAAPSNFRRKPYDHTWALNVTAGEPADREFSIPRRPRVLAKLVTKAPVDNAFWKQLIISVQKTGAASSGYADSQQMWFFDVENWGDSLDITIDQQTGDRRETLLPRTTFTCDEQSWPVEISIGPVE